MSQDKAIYNGGSGHGAGVKIDGPAGADWREGPKGETFTGLQPESVEQEIQRKGLTAPRVTPAELEANIAGEFYFTAYNGVCGSILETATDGSDDFAFKGQLKLLTFCVLVLRNGYTVHGVSACASPENFNEALGKRIARENAVREIWPLMGYALKQRLHDRGWPAEDVAHQDER